MLPRMQLGFGPNIMFQFVIGGSAWFEHYHGLCGERLS